MKRITIILSLVLMLTACTAIIGMAESKDMCSVTFKLPEGHFFTQDAESDDDELPQEQVSELVLQVEKGHVLTEEDVAAFTNHCDGTYFDCHRYCKVTQTGWDSEPVGVTVNEDMTFTAVMNGDTANITVKMSQGNFFCEPIQGEGSHYESFTVTVDRGYTVTEDDVERFSTAAYLVNPGSEPEYSIVGFDKEPLGHVVNEDVLFIAQAKKIIRVFYYIPQLNGEYQSVYDYRNRLLEGDPVTLDTLFDAEESAKSVLENHTVLEAYWDITDEQLAAVKPNDENGSAVWHIYAKVTVLGDCNTDERVNTADAVSILKACVNLVELTEIQKKAADAVDSSPTDEIVIDTGDAVAVLKYTAGLTDEL